MCVCVCLRARDVCVRAYVCGRIPKPPPKKNPLKNKASKGKIGLFKSYEHGDAGGIIFIDFGENIKNRFFIKTVFWI